MLLKRRNKDVQPEPRTQGQDTSRTQSNDKQTADTAPTTAEQALIAELSTLTTAGSGFVPPAPPAPAIEPVQEPAIAPQDTPEGKRIVKFVGVCEAAVTHREICGGAGLQFDVVTALLPALVQSGALRIVAGSENLAQYRLASFTPTPPAPAEPYIHPETAWSNAARARELAKEAANRPKPTPMYEPSDAAVDAMLAAENEKKTTIVLTPEEPKELDRMRNRRPVNPQAFIVG